MPKRDNDLTEVRIMAKTTNGPFKVDTARGNGMRSISLPWMRPGFRGWVLCRQADGDDRLALADQRGLQSPGWSSGLATAPPDPERAPPAEMRGEVSACEY